TGFGTGTAYTNQTFALSGEVSDDVDVANLTITQSKDGGASVTVLNQDYTVSDNDTLVSWSASSLPDGGLATGQYEYVMTVTDSAGKVSTLTRNVTVDVTSPNVDITSLLPMLTGNQINGEVTLSVNASDANGLEGVKYFLRTGAGIPAYTDGDGVLMSAPYSVLIDSVNDLTDSTSYNLYVIARDRGGNDSTSSMNFTVNQASDTPTGEITSPGDGSQLSEDHRIRGTFSDDDGVASDGAVLYIRRTGAPSWTAKSLGTASSAGQLVAWSLDVSDVVTADGDGIYEMYLSVTDVLGKPIPAPVTQTFGFDENAPVLSALTITPAAGAYNAGDVLTLSWTAFDASGLDNQSVLVDGSTDDLGSITNTGGDNYEVVYTVPASGISSGYRSFSLVAEDSAGKTSTRTASFLVDVDDPVVDNGFTLNPSFIGFVPNGDFIIRGTASDNLGLSGVEIELADSLAGLDGSGWTAATLSSGTWSYAVADSSLYVPAAGTLYFRVRAADNAGNVSTPVSFTQAIDQSADLATVSIISPVDSSTYGTTVQISGTATDDDDLYDFNDDGTIDADAVEIEYDTVPASGSWTTVNPTITGSGNSASWNYTLGSLPGGSYTVRARARDDGGTWGNYTGSVEFTVNAGAPNLTVATTVDSYRNNSVIALSGSVADSDGVTDVRVRVNGGSWSTVSAGGGSWGVSNVSDTWSYSLNLGSDGFKTIEFQAEDASGFIANEQFTTRVDTTLPIGAYDSLFQDNPTGSYLAVADLNGEIRITGTVEELNLEDADAVRLRIAEWNGASEGAEILPYTTVNGTYVWNYVWDTSLLADQQYILQLRITDKAGNVTDTVTKIVETDQSADTPEITQAFLSASFPADAGTNVLQSLLKISGTLTDDDGFDSGAVNIYLDGSAAPISGSNTTGTTATWTYTWSSLAEGQHYLSLEATDRNGSAVTLGPTYFLVDTANPALSLTSPAVSAKIKAGTLTISGTAVDGGGLDGDALEIVLDHSNNASPLEGLSYHPVVGGGTFSQSIAIDDTSLDGTLTIFLTLTDRAGKQTSQTRAVTIDTTSPSLSLNYPNPEAYINGLITISGTSDDLNGLADVTLQILDPATKLPITSLSRSSSTMAAWEFAFNSFSYASSTYGEDVNSDGTLWKVYFRLASTDNSGNVAEYLTGSPADWPFVYIDTDGDKPSISINQPKNGDNIGGLVNMFGTATDDDGPVMHVEVRIDFNGDGDFADSRDINNDDSDGDPDTGIALGADQDFYGNTVRVGDADEMWEDESAWYLIPVTNNSWSQNLNMGNELYASNTGGTGDIVIQVRTRDQFGLASEIIERTITLDETFPRIENILPADQSYQNGQFTMTAEFGDNEQLDLSDKSVIGINVNKSGYVYLTAASPELTPNPGNFGYDLSYDIDTQSYFPNSSGILYVDLYVKDQALYQNQKSYTFYVDNQAPSSSWSDRSGAPDGSNLANGMITVNGAERTYVEGNYDDSGVVNGISHIEMYFVDSDGNVRNIKSSGAIAPSATESINVQTYNLATNSWTDTTDSAAALMTNDEAGDDYVIRIDRATEMSSQTLGTDLDGDGYEEFMGVVSGLPRWRAYFDSQYLPDGITELHYIVYDLAGNAVHRMREVFIANNGPAIDRIQIGSDINASGSVSNTGDVSEISDYYYPAGSVDSSDTIKIKNDRIYLNVIGSDDNGTVDNVFVDVYDATGVTRYGNLTSNAGSPLTRELAVSAGSSPWSDGYGTYNLKVIVRDDDQISQSRWVKVELVDPADTTAPVLTLNGLSQGDQDNRYGHLELAGDYGAEWSVLSTAYGDDDPKASGVITLTGKVTDENRIELISGAADGLPVTTLAHWVSGELVSNTPDFVITSQTLNESGHEVYFSYDWDTSDITNTAALNQIISFTARDGGSNVSNTGSQQVDVVPYITGISRDSGTYNTYRSRQGLFILRQAEEVIFTGFNLYNSTADTVIMSNTSGTTTAFNLPSAGSSANGFTLTALNNTVSTGDVAVTVNGLVSINNLNSNDRTYNQEATASAAYDNSWLWTDDRGIHVWISDDNQSGNNRGYFTGSQDPEYPAMAIDGSGILYGSWSNYASAQVYWGPNNGNATRLYLGYDPCEHTDISYGTMPAVVFNSNLYGNSSWSITGAGGTYIWDNVANLATSQYTGTAIRDGNYYGGVYIAEALYHDQKLMQFVNQRIVADGNNYHTSYYDTDTKALKYYYHRSANNVAYAQSFINIDGGSDGDDGSRIVDNGGASRTLAAGEFSAIDVMPGTGYPVIAYYDITNKTVKLARSNNATPNQSQWNLQTVMAADDENFTYSGKYITLKIDSQGYVHLAFYRNSTGDLIYMKSTNHPTDGSAYTFGDSVIIDSIGSVGVWADLTLENDEPVISYLDSSLVNTFDGIKMAYYDPAFEATADEFIGESETEPDTLDGWETMNAALIFEVESVRTSIESDTGTNNWGQAIGYSSNDYFRIGYYLK
ncbi:MAG: Ig-like domain repeat protein, partial [Spirochaetales bacterium]|nr:Ig-like domain repeat protein [Spirochaetales bacterium]